MVLEDAYKLFPSLLFGDGYMETLDPNRTGHRDVWLLVFQLF